MIDHRRREIQARDQFAFCKPNQRASDDLNPSDGVEYGTWAERIKAGYGYFGKPDDQKLGAWQRRAPLNHYDEDEFRWLAREEDDDSDVPSPPLWKEPRSPVTRSGETSPIHDHHDHHHDDKDEFIYPTPRAQVIARYRQEMLDLVRGMPETAYELSLRDLVESQRIAKPSELPKTEEEKEKEKDPKEKMKKGARRRMLRSESTETEGLLLKMFLPNSLTGARKSFAGSGACAKVSPKPLFVQGEKGGLEKRTERDWWKKNTSSEKGSSSSTSSTSSSNSSSKSRSRKMSGCYYFFLPHRNRGSEE